MLDRLSQRELGRLQLQFAGFDLGKVEYVVENVGGRNQVRKVGLQPVQRDGLEYEFTVVGDVTQDHDLVVTKTRAAFLKDAVIREAGEDLGRQLAAWLASGTSAPRPAVPPSTTAKAEPAAQAEADEPIAKRIRDYIAQAKDVRTLGKIGTRLDELLSSGEISDHDWSDLTDVLNTRHDEIQPQEAAS